MPGLEHVAPRRDARARARRSARRRASRRPRSRLSSPRVRKSSCVTSGASPSDGSSSSTSLGRAISARGDREHLLLAAAHAARLLRRGARSRRGNVAYQRSMSASISRSAAPVRADAQVLVDGEVDDRAAALGHVRDARGRDLLGAPAEDRRGRRTRRGPAASIIPESARSVVVLPAPFAPRITTTSPSSTEKSSPCSTRTAPYPARSSETSSSAVTRPASRGRPR